MNFWIVILGVGLLTFLERGSFILFLSRWDMPPLLVRALRFVPSAVFAALIAPAFFLQNGQLNLNPMRPEVLAGVLATIVSYRYQNLLASIFVGFVAYWLLLLL